MARRLLAQQVPLNAFDADLLAVAFDEKLRGGVPGSCQQQQAAIGRHCEYPKVCCPAACPFGATGYVAFYEIASSELVLVLAVRHQLEEDYRE